MSTTTRWLTAVTACGVLFGLTPAAQAAPEPWAFLPWDEAVGRVLGQEADSEGPKSFALAPGGGILVLDQVNHRVLELDAGGLVTGAIELPAATFDDVEVFDGRAVLALDRLAARTLLVLDLTGERIAEVAVEGRGIERSGLITALLPRSDGVWLEVAHRHSVKVLDRHLRPCDRQVVLGRPVAGGQRLHGALDRRGGVTLSIGPRFAGAATASVTLRGAAPVRRLVWMDVDARGDVHAVLHELERSAQAPFSVLAEQYRRVRLDGDLRERSRSQSPWVLTLLDQRVELRVAPDGTLWQMAFTPEGVALIRWEGGQP
jgi:hypothetical protein